MHGSIDLFLLKTKIFVWYLKQLLHNWSKNSSLSFPESFFLWALHSFIFLLPGKRWPLPCLTAVYRYNNTDKIDFKIDVYLKTWYLRWSVMKVYFYSARLVMDSVKYTPHSSRYKYLHVLGALYVVVCIRYITFNVCCNLWTWFLPYHKIFVIFIIKIS